MHTLRNAVVAHIGGGSGMKVKARKLVYASGTVEGAVVEESMIA